MSEIEAKLEDYKSKLLDTAIGQDFSKIVINLKEEFNKAKAVLDIFSSGEETDILDCSLEINFLNGRIKNFVIHSEYEGEFLVQLTNTLSFHLGGVFGA